MYNKIVKTIGWENYNDWLKRNDYSIFSPRHRGFYAEMVFRRYCLSQGITAVRINKNIDLISQIPAYFLKKIQQKEIEKLGRLPVDFFCYGKNQSFFVVVKMGTSNIASQQRNRIEMIRRNKTFLFRVFEDGEAVIRQIHAKKI